MGGNTSDRPTTSCSVISVTFVARNMVVRLKQLKELNDLKMISKEDYDKKVKEIMDTL